MKKLYLLTSILFFQSLFLSTEALAQFSPNKRVSGILSLESGAATKDVQIVITVSAYTILRSFRSSRSTTVTIKAGLSSANYAVTGIDGSPFNPVYTIRFSCSNCPNIVDQQYYSPVRQLYSRENSAYLDSDELPLTLNYLVRAGTSISGVLSLRSNQISDKNLVFEVNALINNASGNSFVTRQFVMAQGNSFVNYRLDGIIPEVGHSSLVAYKCLNCDDNSIASGQKSYRLTTQVNHTNVDFDITLTQDGYMPAVIQLLLDDLAS